MKRDHTGKYQIVSTLGEKVKAFIPDPLPPVPPIDWSGSLRERFDEAWLMLGRLDGFSTLLPDIDMLLYSYIRKEAVLSSMIEGTQSSLSDLLLYENDQNPGVPLQDAQEVSQYIAALNHGMERIRSGFPLSLRLIREMHEILLSTERGKALSPGEFRMSQNWIGGSRPGNAAFVPPPPLEVPRCMSQLELFINDKPDKSQALQKAALVHVQFETIHPFLDGNGRIGRLLITLILWQQKILSEPLLYLSLYFKTHRQTYYQNLNEVRMNSDWETWLEFFADGIIATAEKTIDSTRRIHQMMIHHREMIHGLRRAAPTALKIHQILSKKVIADSGQLVTIIESTALTVNRSLELLQNAGIVREITGRKRDRIFAYAGYLDILNEEMDFPN